MPQVMTYSYTTQCYVCKETLDPAQLPADNTPAKMGSPYGNTYALLKQRYNVGSNNLHVQYRHRYHGEAGERPYKMTEE
jgi:hypothetical protein